MFFILMDYEVLTNNWIRIFPAKNRPFWRELMQDAGRELNNYVRGQGLVALCMGIMFCIGFTIIGFPMAIGLGILIGILDLVPYLHTFALIPTAFLYMLKAADTGQDFWVVFGMAVLVFAVVQVITDLIVTPKIMGKAMVDGYQQKADTGIAACLKHFAGYGAVNAGREYNDVEISQRTFLEQYVKPFRMALKAKPAMVMTAFNAIDRKPISGNKELLKGLLRDKEGFEGTVISDWGSIGQLEEQGVAADMEEAAIQASEAGVDIDMMSPAYMLCLEKLVESGKIPEAFVDESTFSWGFLKIRLTVLERVEN